MTTLEHMNECMVRDLALFLVVKREMTISEAVSCVLNSKIYEKLCDPRTGLYFQSPVYVYSFLEKELEGEAF